MKALSHVPSTTVTTNCIIRVFRSDAEIPPSQSALFCAESGNDDTVIVHTPPFAESVTEGDVRWDKGEKRSIQGPWSMFVRGLRSCHLLWEFVKVIHLLSLTAVGDAVAEDEVVGEIETDKVSLH